GGMNENKVLRVVGLASSLPLDVANPLNPMNRRISLVVLNDKTERQIRGLPEEPVEEIQTVEDAADVLAGDRASGDGGLEATEPSREASDDVPGTQPQRLAEPAGTLPSAA